MLRNLFRWGAWGASSGLSDEVLKKLSEASVAEARSKEARLRAFYRDPYGDGSERWWLPEFNLDYLRTFKIEGQKRKNPVVENILHEFDPLLWMRGLFKAGILPPKITFQVVKEAHQELPLAMQPIFRLFNAITIHDLDEDFAEVNLMGYIAYICERINQSTEIPNSDKSLLRQCVQWDGKAMTALTFGRKTYDANNKIVKEITHGGDINKYGDALERDWASAAAKPPDRCSGLMTRYGEAPDFFTIEKDDEYREETRILFMQRQFCRDMQRRYPELSDFFATIDANLSIGYRGFDAMTSYHPSRLKGKKDTKYRPESARIDLPEELLKQAFRGSKFLEPDEQIQLQMIKGYEFEAKRHPPMVHLVSQMQRQLGPFLKSYTPMTYASSAGVPEAGVDLE